jgi:hypothetical protein
LLHVHQYTYTHAISTDKPSVAHVRLLRDGVEVKMCDGIQRAFRAKDHAFYCPYPLCEYRTKNSYTFKVRSQQINMINANLTA